MTKQSWQKKTGLTPGKTLLIGVLGLIFIVVVVLQFTGGSEQTQASTRGSQSEKSGGRNRSSVKSEQTTKSEQPAAPRRKIDWPSIPLSETMSHNPFKLPSIWMEKNTQSESDASESSVADDTVIANSPDEAVLRALQNDGVSLIISTPSGIVAHVGDRALRVDDVIGGYRVVEIQPDGVLLVPAKGQ